MRKVFRDMKRFLKYRVKTVKRRMMYLAYSSVCKKRHKKIKFSLFMIAFHRVAVYLGLVPAN